MVKASLVLVITVLSCFYYHCSDNNNENSSSSSSNSSSSSSSLSDYLLGNNIMKHMLTKNASKFIPVKIPLSQIEYY